MEKNPRLTAAHIRYLLAMKAFTDAGKPIRLTYLADHFQYKKSSIHSMVQNLLALGMIEKDENSIINLTEKGADTASRYTTYYSKTDIIIQRCFPGFDDRENAVLALIAEIPEPILQNLSATP